MSLMRYFARNSIMRLAAFGIGVAVSFLVTPHVLRCLGKSGYGVWSLIVGLYVYFALLDCGVYQSVTKKYSAAAVTKKRDTIQGIYSSGTCILFVSFLVILVSGWFLAYYRERLFGGEFSSVLGVCILVTTTAFAFMVLFRSAYGLLAGGMHWTLIAAFSTVRLLISAAGVLIFMSESFSAGENLLRMAYISTTAFLAEQACIVFAARRLVGVRFSLKSVSLDAVKDLLRFGLPLQVIAVGNLLKNNSQIYIVATVINITQVTMLSLANQLIRYMRDILMSAFGILNPYFSRLNELGDDEECRVSLLAAIRLSYAASTTIGLGLIFYGMAFFTRWLGPGYEEIQQVMVPLALANILGCGEMPVTDYFIGVAKHRFLAAYTVWQGIAVAALSFPAAWFWGLAGVGWVVCVCTAFVSLWLMPRRISDSTGLPLLRYYRELLTVLGLQVAAQFAFYLCVRDFIQPDFRVILAAGFGQTLVSAAVFMLSAKFAPPRTS